MLIFTGRLRHQRAEGLLEPRFDGARAHGGRENIADHARRKRVGDRAFEAVADLDAEFVVVLHDEQQEPAVFALLA